MLRNEGGIPALLTMVQSTDIRVQRMALKAINNVVIDCESLLNQEEFVNQDGLIIFLKLLLTVDQNEKTMIHYLLNIISSLIQTGILLFYLWLYLN